MDYEVKIDHDKSSVERIYLVAKFVDADNAEDLQVHEWSPLNNDQCEVKPDTSRSLSKHCQKKGDGDDELKLLLKQLVASMLACCDRFFDHSLCLPQVRAH